jgi:tryptophan halogenase
MADQLSDAQLGEFLGNVRRVIERTVAGLPRHEDYIAQHCAAPDSAAQAA